MKTVLPLVIYAGLILASCGPAPPATAVITQTTTPRAPVRCGLEVRKTDNSVLHIVCDAKAAFTLTDVVLNAGLCASPFDEDISLADVDDDPRHENSAAVKRAFATGERFTLVLPRGCALTSYTVVTDQGQWAFRR